MNSCRSISLISNVKKMTRLMFLLVILACSSMKVNSFSLTTKTTVQGSPKELFNFIATPTNWPSIVLSSHSVKKLSSKNNPVDAPLKVGDGVEEVFGLPPLLPLSVSWECVVADEKTGQLEFFSKDGVPNLAKNCSMKFNVAPAAGESRTDVELVMGYEALNPLVFAATPILNLDNSIALKLLLPLAMKQ